MAVLAVYGFAKMEEKYKYIHLACVNMKAFMLFEIVLSG